MLSHSTNSIQVLQKKFEDFQHEISVSTEQYTLLSTHWSES